MLADPKAALADLADLLRARRSASQAEAARARVEEIAARTEVALGRHSEQTQRHWDDAPISAPRLMHELRETLPADALVFSEAISNQAHLAAALLASGPERLMNGRGGGIGPGLPGTLGVQLACPDRKVVGVCSDGAAMYSITALWTAAHHRIPAAFVMLNNGAYRILKLNMIEYLGAAEAAERGFTGMDLTDPPLRFDLLAQAMGVPALRAERPEELRPALEQAMGHDGPFLVDVVMDCPVPM
jgi:benzoylformate decarboxylase